MTARLLSTPNVAVDRLLTGPDALFSEWQSLDILPPTESALARLYRSQILETESERMWIPESAIEAVAVPILIAMLTDNRRKAVNPANLCLILLGRVISDGLRDRLEPLYFGFEDNRPLFPEDIAPLLVTVPAKAVKRLTELFPQWVARAKTFL